MSNVVRLIPAVGETRSRWKANPKKRGGNRKATKNHAQLGGLIRARREVLHLTLGDAGDMVGVSGEQWRKWEAGDNRIDFIRMLHVADALKIHLSYFTAFLGHEDGA